MIDGLDFDPEVTVDLVAAIRIPGHLGTRRPRLANNKLTDAGKAKLRALERVKSGALKLPYF